MPDGRASPHRLNLQAIEATLRQVQARFEAINAALVERRDKLDDRVIGNMMAGYRLVDGYVASGVDLFALEGVGGMIEVNTTVLCGDDPARRRESASHIAATERRFYEQEEDAIGDLVEWREAHRGESMWKRAAGTFVRVLSKPQLFIEGNHRSGALIMSHILVREGFPPFVLSVDNARGFFNPTTLMRRTRKKGVATLYRLPKIKARHAEFLESQAEARFLLDPPAPRPGAQCGRATA